MILVTGGAGFIGSHFVLTWLKTQNEPLINLDKLTYASNLDYLREVAHDVRYQFVQADISDSARVGALLRQHQVRAVVHFAAESHVDRSIACPENFVQTNVVGTFRLLEATRDYWPGLAPKAQRAFRFLHVSTDEVYGSLEQDAAPCKETHPYAPNNPYAASKAAADHLVRAYGQTYGLPTLTTHSSNNFGPHHFPEKLIPLCLQRALADQTLPIYGDGQQIRDWLYVTDHCYALRRVLEAGQIGASYNVGGGNARTNLDLVQTLCRVLDQESPRADGRSYAEQIRFVQDRPGHDRRYAIDTHKITTELGWKPAETLESGLRKTVQWFLTQQEGRGEK